MIALDAGDNPHNITSAMEKTGLDPAGVKAVFLTHSDDDHRGALALFTRATIYISKAEEQMINGEKTRMLVFHNKPIPTYSTLEDDQTVKLGPIEVKCIYTPGHTPGAVCYLVNGKYLFTGDSMSLKNGSVEPFNEFFNMDTEREIQSWAKIISLPGVKYMFTAHYGLTGDFAGAFAKWRK